MATLDEYTCDDLTFLPFEDDNNFNFDSSFTCKNENFDEENAAENLMPIDDLQDLDTHVVDENVTQSIMEEMEQENIGIFYLVFILNIKIHYTIFHLNFQLN
jgi:hypothetical protein